MYEIIKYRPEFKPQLAKLQTHLWGGNVAANVSFLQWKYEHNPYIVTPLIRLAIHEGRVIGRRGLLGRPHEAGWLGW